MDRDDAAQRGISQIVIPPKAGIQGPRPVACPGRMTEEKQGKASDAISRE
jgi:hypothetical protein